MVNMTKRSALTRPSTSPAPKWRLYDAKTRFSELVRRATTDGPQRVTVKGREAVVVLSAADYDRLKGEPTGQLLVEAMRHPLARDILFDRDGERLPVSDPMRF